jgi:hypothetical protein
VATEVYVIEQVRRKVADYKEPRTYEKAFYTDALTLALGKLNNDYGETYATIPDVPVNRVYLVVLLASIDMCHIRASEAFDDEASDATRDVSQLSVPDLSISSRAEATTSSGENWLELAQELQETYDTALENAGGQSQTAEVQVGTIRRISKTHGGYANRKLDPGPDAVTIIATVDGSTVTISWDALLVNDFGTYDVYRSDQSDMTDEERLKVISDNHIVEYDDEDVEPGTYYYRVRVVNPNELTADSNIETAVVT